MFIVWGRKIVHRKIGYVADFCPICREPRSFLLRRVGSAGHIYYISAGQGQLVGHDRVCQHCGTAFHAEPSHYAAVSDDDAPLPKLTVRTFPKLFEAYADRLELERRVREAPQTLSGDERQALIRSPFVLLSPKVEKRFASTHLDKESWFALAGLLALITVVPAALHGLMPDDHEMIFIVCFFLGLAMLAWQLLSAGRRFMTRQVVPQLAETLAPLQPTEDELKRVLAEMKQLGHVMGKRLRLPELQAALTAGR